MTTDLMAVNTMMSPRVRESSVCVGDQGTLEWSLSWVTSGATQPRVRPRPSHVQVTRGPSGWQRYEAGAAILTFSVNVFS